MSTVFGVELTGLEHNLYPEEVPGRVLHIDGDFIAYHCSYNNEEAYESMISSADTQIEELRLSAGAEGVVVHLTGKNSSKGGRYAIAIQKPYQFSRSLQKKPVHLEDVRLYLKSKYQSQYWLNQEADDGLAQANWNAIQKGEHQLSVIVSKDKDLRQVLGLQMDWDTKQIHCVNGYGGIELQNSKLVGYGPAFFFAQMLMGDRADDIQGLASIHRDWANKVMPTKAVQMAKIIIENPDSSPHDVIKAKAIMNSRPHLTCGDVSAFRLLSTCKSSAEALELILELYLACGDREHHHDGRTCSWHDVVHSEAQLLWMRRTPSINDVFQHWDTDVDILE